MSIRFAPAAGSMHHLSALMRSGHRQSGWRLIAANDDHPATEVTAFDSVLVTALRHFARHGLDAAASAQRTATDALADGDGAQFDRWVAITRCFDPRLARQTERVGRKVRDILDNQHFDAQERQLVERL
jgi:hypothetical protein